MWKRTADLAAEYPDVLVHTHLLELDESNTMARSNGAEGSLALLNDVGLSDERLVAAHFRVADDEDVQRTAAVDASVAHYPSVFCYWNPDGEMQWTPVTERGDAGVDVGLGIDHHYWHDSYSMFGEARLAGNLKRETGQYSSMELVRMLPIDGAPALGIDDQIGSLEPGKRADLILLDVDTPKFTPLTDVPAHVVNNAAPADVETVIVDGEIVMRDGTQKTMDATLMQEHVNDAVDGFADETGRDLHVGGGDPPSTLDTVREVPRRGPARLLSRLAVQTARDKFPL